MAQNKLENQIREKLNNREIQPSVQAWDRLDAMLTVAEAKKVKRTFFLSFPFIGIAAGVLVLISLGLFLFNQNIIETETINKVVETNTYKKDTINRKNSEPQIPVFSNKDQVVKAQDNNIQKRNNQRVSIINKSKNSNESTNQKLFINQNQSMSNLENETVVKNTPQFQKDNDNIAVGLVNDEALFATLNAAANKAIEREIHFKTNPKSLLNEVDGELEKTFRERVLTTINKKYNSARETVANRNINQ